MTLLQSNLWRVSISPKHGAAILACAYDGHDILRPGPDTIESHEDMFQTGHFPLVPYSNRISAGQIEFEHIRYRLNPTQPSEPYPLHGLGWIRPWQTIRETDTQIDLRLDHEQDEFWPWSFRAEHKITIEEHRLNFALSVTNKDSRIMPTGLGFHPYLANCKRLSFKTDVTHIQKNGPNNLPFPDGIKPMTDTFSNGVSVKDLKTDNCYLGRKGDVTISWSDRNMRLVISPSKTLPHTVIYSNPELGHFCIEPVSHINNALNLPKDPFNTGLAILNPGEQLSASMCFTIT